MSEKMTHVYTGRDTLWGLKSQTHVRILGKAQRSSGLLHCKDANNISWRLARSQLKPINEGER